MRSQGSRGRRRHRGRPNPNLNPNHNPNPNPSPLTLALALALTQTLTLTLTLTQTLTLALTLTLTLADPQLDARLAAGRSLGEARSWRVKVPPRLFTPHRRRSRSARDPRGRGGGKAGRGRCVARAKRVPA